MNPIVEFFTEFGIDDYMWWSRIQGPLWTAADIAIALLLIRCANLCRKVVGVRQHQVSAFVVYASVLPALLLLFAPTPAAFYRLELVVTVPHFAVILYVLAVNVRIAPRAFAELTRGMPADDPPSILR